MVHTNRSGFSLMEIMIAVTIMGIIAAGAVKSYTTYTDKTNKTRAKTELLAINGAVQSFEQDTGSYPARLKDLLKRPQDERVAERWDGPYLDGGESRLEDPWRQPYKYKLNESGSAHPYELYSYGPGKQGAPKEAHISVWKIK